MSREAHTVEDFGQPEYLDGAMMRFALSNEQDRRTAYVATKENAVLYAAAPALLEALVNLYGIAEAEGIVGDRTTLEAARAAIHSATGEG